MYWPDTIGCIVQSIYFAQNVNTSLDYCAHYIVYEWVLA